MSTKHIGILSGIFDPIHKGHVALALEAAHRAELDEVYFLVEAKPWRKTHVTPLGHRIAMLKLAIKPYPKLKVLDLPDKTFSVAKTLPRLRQKFVNDELYFIAGSDMLEHMPEWPLIGQMLKHMRLIISVRDTDKEEAVKKLTTKLLTESKALVIKSKAPFVSSKQIREAIHRNEAPKDISPGVYRYIKANWLYTAPSSSSSSS